MQGGCWLCHLARPNPKAGILPAPVSAPGYNKGGCVALATGSSVGLWEVKSCSTFKAKYICRQNLGTPVNPELPGPYPTPSLAAACPLGWSSDSKLRYCYKVRGAGVGGGCPGHLGGACASPLVRRRVKEQVLVLAKGSLDPTSLAGAERWQRAPGCCCLRGGDDAPLPSRG